MSAGKKHKSVYLIDLDQMRERVTRWLAEHPGTDDQQLKEQIAGDLAGEWPEYHPGDVGIVLRGTLLHVLEQHRQEHQP